MPFITRRLLPAAILLVSFTTAQTCYYPDGKTVSKDLPCDANVSESSCCGADSFCLAGGLCYSGGIVERGSCTDQAWGPACAGYCKNVDTSSSVAITPCTSNEGSNDFVCGVNTTACQTGTKTFTLSSDASIILRPAQIAQLVGTALATASATAASAADSSEGYTAGTLAGVAVGIAVPLLLAIATMYLLLRREQRRFSKPRLMYKLPDDITKSDFTFTPPPPVLRTTSAFSSRRSSNTSRATAADTIGSRGASMRTTTTVSTPRPTATPSFLERYDAMRAVAKAQLVAKEQGKERMSPASPRHELPSPMDYRHELSSQRMSKE